MTQPPQPPGPPTPPSYDVYPVVPPAKPPLHEHASLSLGLGVIGLLGGCACGVGLLISPFALGFGIAARRAVAADPDRWRGSDVALTGIVLGAIGTVLLALAVIAATVWAVVLLAGGTGTGTF